jgi:hypothetical protein
VDPRADVGYVENRKFLTLPRLELQPLSRLPRIQILNRLRYPNQVIIIIKCENSTATVVTDIWKIPEVFSIMLH